MSSAFKIYSASAGSGKTFALAKSYLKHLISSPNPEHFKHLLAITFTNKAVGEMKARIIDMLKLFSSNDFSALDHPMAIQICEELQLKPNQLREKSERILKHIIYNYGAFSISTIDGFTHRVIRTFARDLNLPSNFQVELDQDLLLNKAVDQLVAKAGTDKQLTKVLVDFAMSKADDDKSWDITYDLNKIAKLLVSENDLKYLDTFKDKSLDDFEAFKAQISKSTKAIELKLKETAKSILTLIDECGLQFDDFSRSYLPKHFVKLSEGNFSMSFDTKWQTQLLDGEALYPKRVTDAIAATINEIQPTLADAFTKTKLKVYEFKFLKAIYKNSTPLSVLKAIGNELELLKTDENKLLISEFNTIISNEIKHQPTPFIYERLGEKFRHYFIDEFQDTSLLQWQNLVPLMDNALSSANGSAMLVGDAKQAIYRWRGGEAQQFIDLYNRLKNPFQIEAKIHNLNTNYRSHKAVVNFNNALFSFISKKVFSNQTYEQLYNDAAQNINSKDDGYVKLSFLDVENSTERDEAYCQKTLDIIQNCLSNGYTYNDISVLVRKKKEGIAIANFLTQYNIPIISSETVLAKNSPKVQLITNMLQLLSTPEDSKCKITVLSGIATLLQIEEKHTFFKAHLNLDLARLLKNLGKYGIHLNANSLLQMPLYEMVETLVRQLGLVKRNTSDGYIQCYLDAVLDFSQSNIADIAGFLEYFDKRKDRLSIAMPPNLNAVSVMTIHKAKGLEFPVVIFPYSDLDIYRELDPKVWLSLPPEVSTTFNYAFVDYNKDVQHYTAEGETLYNQHQSELELDNINLLYVALTRAVAQLYVVAKKDISNKGVVNERTYSGILIQYLIENNLWNTHESDYDFGRFVAKTQSDFPSTENDDYEFISEPRATHNLNIVTKSGYLWDTNQEKAIERGNLIHLILSKIKTVEDVDFAFNTLLSEGEIEASKVKSLKEDVTSIVNHKDLKQYFTAAYTSFNEKEVITAAGAYLRPDRISIKKNDAVIIDYKTGKAQEKHMQQILDYANALSAMNYTVDKKLLVYLDERLHILEVK